MFGSLEICTTSEKNALLFGRAITKTKSLRGVLFWKTLLINFYGYGMFF